MNKSSIHLCCYHLLPSVTLTLSIIRIKPVLTPRTAKENRTPLIRTPQLRFSKIHLRVPTRRTLLTSQRPMIDLILRRDDLNRSLEPSLQGRRKSIRFRCRCLRHGPIICACELCLENQRRLVLLFVVWQIWHSI